MPDQSRLLFNARGRLGMINPDGTEERYPAFDVPRQTAWGWGPLFPDGRRIVLVSYEEGKVWEGNVRTHLWLYDLDRDRLEAEIATRGRPAPFMVCSAVLPGGERMIVNPVIDGEQRVMTMDLDGSDQHAVTRAGEGFTYCVQLSPDRKRLAFHAAGIPGRPSYRIFVTDLDGGNRVEVAGDPDHLYFGPMWSPDGRWLVYQDCLHRTDPGHDWADLCLGRPDGPAHRTVTEGQRQWFATSYGNPETRGGGSNMAQWAPDGRTVTYTRAEPGSCTAWPYQADRPDTDHFNRDYHPEAAQGGTVLCLLNPFTGDMTDLMPCQPRVWHFRAAWSPDGTHIAFCRAPVGEPSALWVMEADGRRQRLLTRGYQDKGADHPVWWGR
jgi:TolB protein